MRRREFLAVSVTGFAGAVGGCLGSDGYDVDAVKAEAEQVPYDEMSEGDRIHVERGQVRQVQAGDSARYFIYTEQEDGEWTNDIFGTWEGEQFEVDDEVELWGVVEGTLETEEGSLIPEVTIVDMQSAG
ncbi:MAG: hypothetical protein U5J64_03710 [Halobacteriales archaeon]|nr:hypothetical protein [Halobacteriales archaeon]